MIPLYIFSQLPDIQEPGALPWENPDDCLESLSAFCSLIDIAISERDSKIFYDELNVDAFFEQVDILFDEQEYFSTPRMMFREIFRTAQNWGDEMTVNNSCCYFLWDLECAEAKILSNNILREIAERLISVSGKCLLLPFSNPNNTRNFFPVFKDANHIPGLPVFAHIYYAFDKESLEKWLAENRQPRLFNLSPKHGENGQGHWPTASRLLCSRDRAKELLETAIGDKRITDELYNFDEEQNCYIVFKYEGENPQNQYHAYHLPINSNEIHDQIKTLLRQRNRSLD